MKTKINHLLAELPAGAIINGYLLKNIGLSRQSAYQYVLTGWLEKVGNGAFKRAGEQIDWQGGLYALQHRPGMSIHAGAVTALGLAGAAHFIPLGKDERVVLISDRKEHVPAWFGRSFPHTRHYCVALFKNVPERSFSISAHKNYSIKISCPERAIMEQMKLARTNHDILHACRLMEGLVTLRPDMVRELLEQCTSVRVKRLFLWSAVNEGHAWMNRLDISGLDLGSGKRQVYRGGKYNRIWKITVPSQEEIDGL